MFKGLGNLVIGNLLTMFSLTTELMVQNMHIDPKNPEVQARIRTYALYYLFLKSAIELRVNFFHSDLSYSHINRCSRIFQIIRTSDAKPAANKGRSDSDRFTDKTFDFIPFTVLLLLSATISVAIANNCFF